MKYFVPFSLLVSLVCLMMLTSSCEENLCSTTVCHNGGICDDGLCDCPPGTAGVNCLEIISVQTRLDAGETPLEIVNSGTAVEDLYGASYAGGLIFFVDVDGLLPGVEGMVAATQDQGSAVQWGCRDFNTEAPNVANTSGSTSGSHAGPGFDVGEGSTNTAAIVNSCPDTPFAAALCTSSEINGYTDWFLPSAKELEAMHTNLSDQGYGNFSDSFYWSSSETQRRDYAITVSMTGPLFRSFTPRNSEEFVRAARAF